MTMLVKEWSASMPEVWPLMLGFATAAVLAAVVVYAFNYHKTRFALGSAVMGLVAFLLFFCLSLPIIGLVVVFNLPS